VLLVFIIEGEVRVLWVRSGER